METIQGFRVVCRIRREQLLSIFHTPKFPKCSSQWTLVSHIFISRCKCLVSCALGQVSAKVSSFDASSNLGALAFLSLVIFVFIFSDEDRFTRLTSQVRNITVPIRLLQQFLRLQIRTLAYF